MIDSDYNSTSGRSVRIVGFSTTADDPEVIVLIEGGASLWSERVAVQREGQTDLSGRGAVMSKLEELLDAEGAAAEAGEADQESPLPAGVKVTRGHDRAKTLQIRLNESELAELVALAADRGLPVSTVARQLLLQSLSPVDDLKSALDRLERDILAVRRKALSA